MATRTKEGDRVDVDVDVDADGEREVVRRLNSSERVVTG